MAATVVALLGAIMLVTAGLSAVLWVRTRPASQGGTAVS